MYGLGAIYPVNKSWPAGLYIINGYSYLSHPCDQTQLRHESRLEIGHLPDRYGECVLRPGSIEHGHRVLAVLLRQHRRMKRRPIGRSIRL